MRRGGDLAAAEEDRRMALLAAVYCVTNSLGTCTWMRMISVHHIRAKVR